jgi:hypothetical protein
MNSVDRTKSDFWCSCLLANKCIDESFPLYLHEPFVLRSQVGILLQAGKNVQMQIGLII